MTFDELVVALKTQQDMASSLKVTIDKLKRQILETKEAQDGIAPIRNEGGQRKMDNLTLEIKKFVVIKVFPDIALKSWQLCALNFWGTHNVIPSTDDSERVPVTMSVLITTLVVNLIIHFVQKPFIYLDIVICYVISNSQKGLVVILVVECLQKLIIRLVLCKVCWQCCTCTLLCRILTQGIYNRLLNPLGDTANVAFAIPFRANATQ